MERHHVRFAGLDLILLGDLTRGGALAMVEDYEIGRCSYAHLFPDGRVLRFREQIGTREDIEVGEPFTGRPADPIAALATMCRFLRELVGRSNLSWSDHEKPRQSGDE